MTGKRRVETEGEICNRIKKFLYEYHELPFVVAIAALEMAKIQITEERVDPDV